MNRIFEFECSKGHRHESYTAYEQKIHQCPRCDELAKRVISTPRIRLEGISGAFPSASDAWANKHIEATTQARKRSEERLADS
jgi:hypothetical protein